MKKITVTEDNFYNILERLQKICNKYKMFKFYSVFTENMKEEKQYRNKSIGFRNEIKRYRDKMGEYNYKSTKKFFSNNMYVRITKHKFREEFEKGINSFDSKLYTKMKSLIYFDLCAGAALVISVGDKIQFLPLGGFIVWTDNNYSREDEPLVIYKTKFIPDFFNGKISNLEEENAIRDYEWEKESELWNDMDEKMFDDFDDFDDFELDI